MLGRKSKPGGIIEQSCGASAPHRVTDEVTLPRAIPAAQPLLAVLVLSSGGNLTGISCRGNQRPERFALPFELQRLSPLAGFEPATVVRSSSCLHHSANSCGGNQRIESFPMRPRRLSESLRRGIRTRDLSAVGFRRNPVLHHAANSAIFFITSLLPFRHYFVLRTPVAFARQLSIAR
jgi:hypothetical protein